MAVIEFENGQVIEFEGEPSMEDIEFAAQEMGIQPEKEKGLTGAGKVLPTFISGQEPEKGERTLLGNIFERPAASSREAIREQPALALTGPFAGLLATSGVAGKKAKEAATRGAAVPEDVKTFQMEAIEKFAPKTESVLLNFLGGVVPSASGLLSDIITSPADVATTLLGGLKPKGQTSGQALKGIVDKPIQQAIKPTIRGKTTFKGRQKYLDNAREAVGTIIENKKSLKITDANGQVVNKLPETVDEFSQAVQQTKKGVFEAFDSLTKKGTEKGIKVDLEPIAKELDSVINSNTLKIKDPGVIEHTRALQSRLREQKFLSPTEADDLIAAYNSQLKAFYQNPVPAEASRTVVDSGVVNNLRKGLDEAVSNAPGEFQLLKNKYGALSEIEKDVNRAALSIAKRNSRGLLDYTDIFSGGQIVQGVISSNPARIASGTFQMGLRSIFKALNNPNRAIKQMFSASDAILAKRTSPLAQATSLSPTLLPGAIKSLKGNNNAQ